MKKFRLLKDLPGIKPGAIFEEGKDTYQGLHLGDIFANEKFNTEWFEEIKEKPKPKFKIGDKVVIEDNEYYIITGIKKTNEGYKYYVGFAGNIDLSYTRLATEEEIEKYFR